MSDNAPTSTRKQIDSQLKEHGVVFGRRYRDPASGFEGEVQALYFFKHGCMRVQLRGVNRTTGEPAEFVFDAPELVVVDTGAPVPAGPRTGGPHDLKMDTRGGRP